MDYLNTRFRNGGQAQHLDDLEDILNSPAPALDSASSTADSQPLSDKRSLSQEASPSASAHQPAAASVSDQSASSSGAQTHCDRQAQEPTSPPPPSEDAGKQPAAAGKRFSLITAYQSASAPLASAWAYVPNYTLLRQDVQGSEALPDSHSNRLPFLLHYMAQNKGATAAAAVAGAAAGGVVAGPLGMAAGAKSGAFMVAVGAAAAGAAQQYFLPSGLHTSADANTDAGMPSSTTRQESAAVS